MDLKEIKELIALMRKNDLSVFKMEKEGFKITLKKGTDFQPVITTAAPVAYPAAGPAAGTVSSAETAAAPKETSNLREILSPMVGTFYVAPSPESPPFVTVGQEVTEDTVVCYMEAMKVMNEIKAECRGVIAEVVAENGKPVQFDQVLFRGALSAAMFNKVLIANRGEIALRVIRACKELGVKTLAVYSTADVDSLHVQLADEAICIGPPPSSQSYLKIDRIISAAEIGDVDAIHPGYGFLSENAHFADVCASCNIKFIGPPADAIRAMGDKNSARATAKRAGMPVTPGSEGIVDTEKDAQRIAREIGYPVMIKATAGGGGRGMRPAHNDGSLIAGYHAARNEAEKAFGNSGVYIEKLIENPHHIEFQIMADSHGDVVHLGERDCSMQRRNQKIIEETPSPIMTEEIRERMGADCVKLAKEVGYVGAGTIECLMDDHGHYYFMEMNTRIQVEHCITEEAYGVDLVKEQIKIAAGEPLSHWMHNAKRKYHAIECRINAEDPFNNFQPCAGKIELYYAPGGRGIRIDSHAYAGYTVPPHYDSMIAKVIGMGTTREHAIERMRRALDEYLIRGIKTTIPFQQAIMHDPDFVRGKYNTSFVTKLIEARGAEFGK